MRGVLGPRGPSPPKPGAAGPAWTAIDAVNSRVERHRARIAVANREPVPIGLVVIHLDVELVRVAVERAVHEVVLSKWIGQGLVRARNDPQDLGRNRVDHALRNHVDAGASKWKPVRPSG